MTRSMVSSHRSVPGLLERYTQRTGRVHLTGLQAAVRITLDQLRRDRSAGLRIGAFYSGYPGSPLAGLDLTLASLSGLLEAEDVRLAPALNEELAAGAVCGTQMLDLFPHSRYDGVLGLWFGKAPGLDRALDVMRHSNFIGISRFGGAIALVGDDPMCKSSSLPSHSETALAHAFVPTFYPSDAAELLALGRYAFALSRYAGLWTAFKIVPEVADGGTLCDLDPDPAPIELPRFEVDGAPFEKRLETWLLAPKVNRVEEEVVYHRLEAARRFAHLNGLNPIERVGPQDRVGLVAAGRLYRELVTALERLGLDARERARRGIRLMQVQMLHPLDERRLFELADGLTDVVVIDERRGYLETHVRAALCNHRSHPRVLGQYDLEGRPWLARHVDVRAEGLAADLAPFLARRLDAPELESRARELPRADASASPSIRVPRKPHFCSGCPHTRSTRAPEAARVGGGIGCHTLALLEDSPVEFINAMGSEGSQWIGLSPYVDASHLFQNVGDGTYFHSGRMALRACVSAGVTITYRILYNGVIAMTGGQSPVGLKSVADLARELLADGVVHVTAVSTDPELTRLAEVESRLSVVPRDQYEAALGELARHTGVTVAIFDQVCSNQKSRLEKRGLRPRSHERVWIHRDVCEGCGDCGRRSACVSLWPVDSALGRKTAVHHTSCTDDRSCLDGECPAFLSVSGDPRAPRALPPEVDALPPAPIAELGDARFEILTVGIGSTGVVTLNAILVRAAEYDGLHALHLDQTGLAQRGGRVTSHCILSREPIAGSARVGWGRADACFALDPLSANEADSLRCLDASRTRTLALESLAPTSVEVRDAGLRRNSLPELRARLEGASQSLFALRASELAECFFGSTRAANVMLLGAALQLGCLPLSVSAIEATIRDSGIAVSENLAALQLGRALAHDPGLADAYLSEDAPIGIGDAGSIERASELLGTHWAELCTAVDAGASEPERSRWLLRSASFAVDLVDYQDRAYAVRYASALARVVRAETAVKPGSLLLSSTAARELYRAMAYKDEYEVARLLLRGPYRRWLEGRFATPPSVHYHLEPPLLRHFGLRRKLRLGRAAEPGLRLLVAARRLRGTRLDPFGWMASRRLEREVRQWYEALLEQISSRLTPANFDRCLELADTASGIRGFEQVKATRAAEVRERVREGLAQLGA